MRIIRDIESTQPEAPGGVLALGVFDGIHLGHRKILGVAVGRARELGVASLACTFDPRPAEVLHPEQAPIPITTLEERLELIGEVGVEVAVVMPFTLALASVEPEVFIEDVLLKKLRVHEIVVGFNHRFGRGARGDTKLLETLAARLGFRAHVVPPLIMDGRAVSSTEIRTALQRGDLDRAQRLLGRAYSLGGEVVRGVGRGRTLGFPTANIKPDRPPLTPLGVFACWVSVGGARYRAVVNVGNQPTFGENAVAIEAHLLDFEGDLYGCRVRLTFVRHLRTEKKFPSVEALREQIGADARAARSLL